MRNLCLCDQPTVPWSTGGAYLRFLYDFGPHKIITGVDCEFPAIQAKQVALLDTGAELSVVSHSIYQCCFDTDSVLGSPVDQVTLHTRLGTFTGNLYRVEVTLTAHWGQPLAIEVRFSRSHAPRGNAGGTLRVPDAERLGGIVGTRKNLLE